jgi:hypothetical protein
MIRSRRAFTLVAFISFMGTLAIGVAILQCDTALGAVRLAANATARVRARTMASSYAASLTPDATGTVETPGVMVTAEKGQIRARVLFRGEPLEITIPR